MTNSNQCHKVIILDDDDRYVKPQLDLAYTKFNIELVHFTNWEEAKTELEVNIEEYQAIIVDGKGQLSKDDKVEDDAHLNVVLTWLMEQKGKGKYLPIFINTGFHEEISKYYKPKDNIIGVYKKGENQTFKLFEDVRQIIEYAGDNKIEAKYPEAFTLFNNNHLQKHKKKILIQCVHNVQDNKFSKEDFNLLREILELIYLKMHEQKILPDVFFSGKKVNLQWCFLYLSGIKVKGPDLNNPLWEHELKSQNHIIPNHIKHCVQFVKEISSTMSHEYSQPHTSFSFTAATFAMMEVLVWFNKYIESLK